MSGEAQIKTVKEEVAEHIADPRNIKGRDSTATTIVNQQSLPEQYRQTGVGCTKMLDPTPTFNVADCEYEIKHENLNCGIVLGRDRPSDKLSGYGGSGVKRSATIDLVAGRMGPEAAATNGKNEIIYCENNFTMDAARIYISQRTNIDQNFKIRSGYGIVEPAVRVSAIGIKADCVRLVARKDIKIVTGTDYYDSSGRVVGVDYKVPKKIMLIGDNRSDLIQPMVKGENLQAMLIELIESIHNITSTVTQFIVHQNTINFAVVNHKHRDRINVNEFGFFSEELMMQANTASKLTGEVFSSMIAVDAKLSALQANYILVPDDSMNNESNILSSYNFCN